MEYRELPRIVPDDDGDDLRPRPRRFPLSRPGRLDVRKLAAVGMFSVLAYTVDQRRGEFGVRLALGATPRHLVRLVMRRGVTFAILHATAMGRPLYERLGWAATSEMSKPLA